jgi:DnaJ family protein C protein 3
MNNNGMVYWRCKNTTLYNTTIMITAVHDYHAALEMQENYQRAREGLERAKKMQKQSERRDYYKILGVNRQSTKKEIVKAYRYVFSTAMF